MEAKSANAPDSDHINCGRGSIESGLCVAYRMLLTRQCT